MDTALRQTLLAVKDFWYKNEKRKFSISEN